jgi:hypothetical protein
MRPELPQRFSQGLRLKPQKQHPSKEEELDLEIRVLLGLLEALRHLLEQQLNLVSIIVQLASIDQEGDPLECDAFLLQSVVVAGEHTRLGVPLEQEVLEDFVLLGGEEVVDDHGPLFERPLGHSEEGVGEEDVRNFTLKRLYQEEFSLFDKGGKEVDMSFIKSLGGHTGCIHLHRIRQHQLLSLILP